MQGIVEVLVIFRYNSTSESDDNWNLFLYTEAYQAFSAIFEHWFNNQ